MRFASVYITGTDTGIGKTHVSCALLRCLRSQGVAAIGMKPVASGCEHAPAGLRSEDALGLIAASDPQLDYASVNPYAFVDPIAPHLAAADSGIAIELGPITAAYRRLQSHAKFVVVEGVGGWLAPLGDRLMQADIVRALDLPVVLVVGLRLGCLNHALLTARAIEADGCRLLGWIGNSIDPDMRRVADNIQTLQRRIQAPLLGIVEHGSHSRIATGIDALDAAVRTLLATQATDKDNTMAKAQRYFISIEDLTASRGDSSELSFDGESPEHLARVLESALREADFSTRWRAMQDDPEGVDAAASAVDPTATVSGSLEAQRSELIVTTSLPHAIVKHRLDLLIGRHWKLRDVSAP